MKDEVGVENTESVHLLGYRYWKWRQYGNRTCTQAESEGKRERSNGERGRDIGKQVETDGKGKRHTETV